MSAKYRDVAPRLMRGPGLVGVFRNGEYVWEEGEGLGPCDYWTFGDVRMAVTTSFAAVGVARDSINQNGITYDDMPESCYDPAARLKAMDEDGIEASLCFPNLIPRFTGQTFLEHKDKDVSWECVRAYNDWIVREWCGDSGGRLIPLSISPLWDSQLAAEEVRRNRRTRSQGGHLHRTALAVGTPQYPRQGRILGSVLRRVQRDWNGHLHAYRIFGPAGVVGRPRRSPVASSNVFGFAMMSLADWLFSGLFERFTDLKIAYSKAEIGWIPALLERADRKWELNPTYYDVDVVKKKPERVLLRARVRLLHQRPLRREQH